MRTINLNNIPTLFSAIKEESIEDGEFSKHIFEKNLSSIVNEDGFYIDYDNFVIFDSFIHNPYDDIHDAYLVINALKFTNEENFISLITETEKFAKDEIDRQNDINNKYKVRAYDISRLIFTYCARTNEKIEMFNNFNYKEDFYDRSVKDTPTYMRKTIELGD